MFDFLNTSKLTGVWLGLCVAPPTRPGGGEEEGEGRCADENNGTEDGLRTGGEM